MSKLVELEEGFSLEALQNGDQAEFARVVEAYSGYIYRLGMKMLQNPQDAEDILQETFIKAFHAFPRFDGRSKVSTWLYRIAANEALMFLRKKRPDTVSMETRYQDESEDDPEPLQIIDWCCLPEEELISDEVRRHLDESIEQLPESSKIVFILRDIEGLSTQETAEALEISEMAVKTRLHRARLQLRELLTAYFRERLPGTI
ncbi:MAG: sigma-70 family RNA polymerase sigma factor [Chloroflexi bacterium]|nr:sigma-70 family RNA polymerase sigma factor [Chloroflexota bacterium]